jgi:hypothetical protein
MTALVRRIAELERSTPAVSTRSREAIWAQGCEVLARLHEAFPAELGEYVPGPMPADFTPDLVPQPPEERCRAAHAVLDAALLAEGETQAAKRDGMLQ